MNAVAYFTCSGQSKAKARDLAEKLGFDIFDLQTCGESLNAFENLVTVFPVHCQGLPDTVKKFLKNTKAKYYSFIALYGKASPGNAIFEAYKITGKNTVTAVYMPCNHTYSGVESSVPTVPDEVIDKILNPDYIKIPRRVKAPFAGVFPAWRSRRLIKITRGEKCVNCNICGGQCPQKVINCGKINGKCSRCLKCVYYCPHGALTVKKGFILERYLRKPRVVKTIIYK